MYNIKPPYKASRKGVLFLELNFNYDNVNCQLNMSFVPGQIFPEQNTSFQKQ